jgi:hypothetical protein
MNISKISRFNFSLITVLFFFIAGCIFIIKCHGGPIKDFGNYYYGSKLLLDGKFDTRIYTNLEYFNREIKKSGETEFFENYLPVPPFTALFYTPFCLLGSINAKTVFNLVSLLLFCLSLKDLFFKLNLRSPLLLLLPIIFIYPFYNNILQGQSYLLILSFLIWIFIATENNHNIIPSLLFALVFTLKVFPIVILLYFLLIKKYRIIAYSLLFGILFYGLSVMFIGYRTVNLYFTEIIPRLFNNEIIGPYHFSNQSLYTLLLNFFTYDQLANPQPFLNSPLLVIAIESIIVTVILCLIYSLRKSDRFQFFSLVIFSIILISRYNTSYSMILLFPAGVALIRAWSHERTIIIISLSLLLISTSFPIERFEHTLLIANYGRFIGMAALYICIIFYLKPGINYQLGALIFAVVLPARYLSFPRQEGEYFYLQNRSGILFDSKIKGNDLILYSTMGEREHTDTFRIHGKISTEGLSVLHNNIFFQSLELTSAASRERNPFLLNDDTLVYMTDNWQGTGFYKLKMKPVGK